VNGVRGTSNPALFGVALVAGDFNGNGIADLAIADTGEDVGAALSAGAVNVLYGANGGLATAGQDFLKQGVNGVGGTSETNDEFGVTLAAGDFNGNRKSDLAIGDTEEDVGAATDAGAVNVLYGTGGGLATVGQDFIRQGVNGVMGASVASDQFGWVGRAALD
jgi:phosphoglycolate phosphatase-like HAD superfamily hydrolase